MITRRSSERINRSVRVLSFSARSASHLSTSSAELTELTPTQVRDNVGLRKVPVVVDGGLVVALEPEL